uniref:methyl-accepting chemotaxis protein n=1 Tax=Azohydromonas lata TaxID=45677 RepID=UPI000A43B8A6
GEVRALAQRSAAAAREIKALIGGSVEQVEAGSRLVSEAGSTMDEIVAQVRRVAQLIGNVGQTMQQQADGIAQVRDTMSQLDTHTQNNAALVEETAGAAQHLRDQAQALENAAAVFRLEAGAHDALPQAAALAPAPSSPKSQATQLIARAARNGGPGSSGSTRSTRGGALPAAPVASVTPAAATAAEDAWEQF